MREEDGSAKALKELRAKVEDARDAYAFVHSDNGRKILARMQRDVQALLNDVAGGEPLEHEVYVKKQTSLATLRGFMNKLQTDAANKMKWEKQYEQRAAEYAARLASQNRE